VGAGDLQRGARILIIGHVATRWALDHYVHGTSLDDLINTNFGWREGWTYHLDTVALDVPTGTTRSAWEQRHMTARTEKRPKTDNHPQIRFHRICEYRASYELRREVHEGPQQRPERGFGASRGPPAANIGPIRLPDR